MAKLVFPTVVDAAYRDFVSKVRTELNKWKQKIERSPAAAADLRLQINALGLAIGGSGYADGTDVIVRNSADSKEVTGDIVFNEVTGLITEVALPATTALVTSAMALTGVTPTGTFTTTVTFTVAAGVITAIALS